MVALAALPPAAYSAATGAAPAMTVKERTKVGVELTRGVYDADRAAALAGVPKSTLHYWARHEIYRPSVSPGPRVRLWSWGDLLALRAIDWFRRTKGEGAPAKVPMRNIRRALQQLEERGAFRERLHELLAVAPGGKELYFAFPGEEPIHAAPDRQVAMGDVLQPVRPYLGGPDLLEPRPLLRIVPGKLHGEPHLLDTRIPSAAIYALAEDGYTHAQIQAMYPEAPAAALEQAIEFERALHSPAA